MSGHSQFKNIMHRKNAQDLKKAGDFTKAVREITIATRSGGGPDPDTNARLRSAILAAREVNLPKDRIENAIKRASSTDKDSSYQEIKYEGYGPGGVAVMVFALSDNVNRTASDVRSTFAKYGGSLGCSGSVSYLFQNIGVIVYSCGVSTEEAMLESALLSGASDILAHDDVYEVCCKPTAFTTVREALALKYGKAQLAEIAWVPFTQISVEDEIAEKIASFVAALKENDDVQDVVTNVDVVL